MADERDPKVSRRYRELGGEEPSRELDQSILAAAHRAADKPHAPLVTPAGRHRWYFSLAAAAILVLAVAVTVQVERGQPDPEAIVLKEQVPQQPPAASEAPPPPPASEAPRAREAPRAAARIEPKKQASPAPPQAARDAPPAAPQPAEPAAQPRESAELAPSDRLEARQELPLPKPESGVEARPKPAPAPPSRPAPGASRLGPQGLYSGDAQLPPAPQAAPAPPATPPEGRVAATAILLSPERLLERIAELRKEGRHNEADQLLAEFRQRYPDYRISEEMLQKVERKK
jgi:hypothetical protein